ncbi:MAG TPA: hypothetical protein VGK18_17000 [Propionicimonas sp.]|uniref:hypothetical protein n=1 Tax=Propionicimonas sp. TaxID=1955623 RepID=UPI002F3EC92E
MIVGVRRALAGLFVGLVVSLGVSPVLPAYAETPTPTPVAASATPSASTGTDIDAPDVAPDNSRQAWALGGAGVVALIAAAVVFLRRR